MFQVDDSFARFSNRLIIYLSEIGSGNCGRKRSDHHPVQSSTQPNQNPDSLSFLSSFLVESAVESGARPAGLLSEEFYTNQSVV